MIKVREEVKRIFMDKHNHHCIHHHTKLVTAVVVTVFLLLGAGEYYLYRQIMYINRMVSEGFMQIKTEGRQSPPPIMVLPK